MNPSFPAACTSEMTPLTKDSPTFSWAPTKTTVSLGAQGKLWFSWERRSSGGNEYPGLHGYKRSAACDDDIEDCLSCSRSSILRQLANYAPRSQVIVLTSGGGKQRRKGEKQLDKPRGLGYAGQDYNRIAADSASHWEGKRESGGNPERSGHCKRGTGRTMPLHFVRRRGRCRSVSQETC